MLNFRIKHRSFRGFSLVELMVGMAAGVILIGSVIGLVVANLQNNAVTVKGIRLTQESRALVEIITRELRRAKYNGNSMAQIGTGASLTTFNSLTLPSSSCVKYAYDADDDGVADSGEFRMFSRETTSSGTGRGVVRYGRFATAAALASASCTTGGSIISSNDIDVTCLGFVVPTTNTTITSSDSRACYSPAPSTPFNLDAISNASIYFAMRLTTVVDGANTTSARRIDNRIMLRAGSN